MAAWTPNDLTNPSFVASQLSAKDRSSALYTVNNELTQASARLTTQEAAYNAASEAWNNGPSRGEINALRAKAADSTLSQTERDASLAQANALADQRDKLAVTLDNTRAKFNDTRTYVNDLTTGQSNLLALGTVPPGTNSFSAPPGFEGRNSPAAEVPDSQNPSPTPTTTTQELQSASPALVADPAQARQQAILDENNAEPQSLPPPLDITSDPNLNPNEGAVDGTTEAIQNQRDLEDGTLEFAGIDTQIANNENALQEPPQLSNEEVDAYLTQLQDERIENERAANIEENVFDPRQEVTENVFDPNSGGPGEYKGLQGSTNDARAKQITQDAENAKTQGDWRVRLSLAPSAGYLYKAENPGILKYLQETDGVIFPYVPQISVNYAAHYDASELTHSNYKIFQYKNSSIDQVTITCDFTAQDTYEANYLLAVIHFFRSVTKMFYGQDQLPKPGTPPPLCYLSGLGGFQFDKHPLVISSFNYNLPNDVDYIRASSPTLQPGVDSTGYNSKGTDSTASSIRLKDSNLNGGATVPAPRFTGNKATNTQPTYVPTKIQIALTAYPIVTRNDISNKFSLKEYATGALLQGSKRSGGGIW